MPLGDYRRGARPSAEMAAKSLANRNIAEARKASGADEGPVRSGPDPVDLARKAAFVIALAQGGPDAAAMTDTVSGLATGRRGSSFGNIGQALRDIRLRKPA